MLSMKTKLTIPQCQEILLRAESEQGAKIFGEIAESISELLGDLRFRNMIQVIDERNAALVRLEVEVKDLKIQLAEKNETANVFMNQARKLQAELEIVKTTITPLREAIEIKDEALQFAHDNWSDCFHDAVSTCKICKAKKVI